MPKRSPPASVTASLITKTVVSAAPTSTTNITGFFATIRGFSLMNESLVARLRISGSNRGRARTPLEMSCAPSVLVSTLGSPGGAIAVAMSKHLSVQHLEMFNNRAQRKRREVCEGANNDNGSHEQDDEQRTVGRQSPAGHRNQFFRCETSGNRQRGNNEEESRDEHVNTDSQVVPGRIGIDPRKGTAVITRAAGIRVHNLGEAVRTVVIGVGRRWPRRIPIMILGERRNRADGRETEDAHRGRQDSDDRHLHFFLLDFLADVFWSASDHEAANENSHHDINQHAVQSGADTAKDDFIGLNVKQRHDPAEGREAVVHTDDGSATRIRGYCRKQCGHGVTEPYFFSFHVTAGVRRGIRTLDPHLGGHGIAPLLSPITDEGAREKK